MRPVTDWAERAAQTCSCPPVVVRFSRNRLKKAMGEQKHPRLQELCCIWLEICEISDQISEIISANLGNFFTGIASSLGRSVSTDSQVGKLTLDPFEADLDCWTCRHHQNQPNPKKSVWVEQVSQFEWVFVQSYSYPKMTWLSRLLHYCVLFLFLPLIWQLLLPMHLPLYMMQFIFKASCY